MHNYDDPVIKTIDDMIDAAEQKIREIELTLKPHKEFVSNLSDVRRRLTGLTQSPSREQNMEKTAREVALEEEIFRLRETLNKKDPFGKGEFDY